MALLFCVPWFVTFASIINYHIIQVSLLVKMIVVTEAFSRQICPVNMEQHLLPEIVRDVCLRLDRPHVDLFATQINRNLLTQM